MSTFRFIIRVYNGMFGILAFGLWRPTFFKKVHAMTLLTTASDLPGIFGSLAHLWIGNDVLIITVKKIFFRSVTWELRDVKWRYNRLAAHEYDKPMIYSRI